jgi:hypothetical protein
VQMAVPFQPLLMTRVSHLQFNRLTYDSMLMVNKTKINTDCDHFSINVHVNVAILAMASLKHHTYLIEHTNTHAREIVVTFVTSFCKTIFKHHLNNRRA